MQLLELALQGVRGFAPQSRFTLKPGLIVLRPKNDPPALSELLSALFYADGRGEDSDLIAAGQASGKAVITFVGKDGETYRIGRNLGAGGVLQKADATRKFQTVSDEAQEIGQYLKGQLGLPSKTAFDTLVVLKPSQLPSRAAPSSRTTPPTPLRSSHVSPSLMPAPGKALSGNRADLEKRLHELEKELERSRELDEIQFQQQGIASELFELEAKEKQIAQLRDEVAEAERACQGAPTPKSLGIAPDIFDRVRRYPEFVRKRDAALLRLRGIHVEREGVRQCQTCGGYHLGGDHAEVSQDPSPEPTPVSPLYHAVPFWGGVAAGAVLLVAGRFLPGAWRYAGLFDIPAFGYAAYFALRHVEELQVADAVIHKHQSRKSMEQKILADFAAEAGPVDAAMKILEVDKPEAVIEALSQGATFAKALEGAQGRLAAALNEPGAKDLAARRDALRKREQESEAQLLEKGQYLRDAQEVERDLYHLRQSLGGISDPPQPPSPGPSSESAVETAPSREDPFPFLLARATDLFNAKLAPMTQSLRERAGQYLIALTDRQLQAIDFDREGKATLTGPNGRSAAAQLSPRELDLAYLAVRLTLAERVVSETQMPLIIDLGLDATEAGKHGLLCKMVKYIATQGQVLQLTQTDSLAGLADAVLSI